MCQYKISFAFAIPAPSTAPEEVKVVSNGPRRIYVTWKVKLKTWVQVTKSPFCKEQHSQTKLKCLKFENAQRRIRQRKFWRARTILPEKYSLRDGLGEWVPREIFKFSHLKCHFPCSEPHTRRFSWEEPKSHHMNFTLRIVRMFQWKGPENVHFCQNCWGAVAFFAPPSSSYAYEYAWVW